MFTTSLFLLIWLRTRDDRTVPQWAWLGLAAGLMTMVRWQNAVFLLFPLTDGLGLTRQALAGAEARFSDIGRCAASRRSCV